MTQPSLYDRMKARGVRMDWYERGKHATATAIPLDDQECSKFSIYLMKANGTLWTIDLHEGTDPRTQQPTMHPAAYKKVRETGRKLDAEQYVCVHTKQAYVDIETALQHNRCKEMEK